MLTNPTAPDAVAPNTRYWLDAKGHAFLVGDHLWGAQYAKAASDEYERQGPWNFEDMWRNGWVRVHVEEEVIHIDAGPTNKPNPAQEAWLSAAANFLAQKIGANVRLSIHPCGDQRTDQYDRRIAEKAPQPPTLAGPAPLNPPPSRTVAEATAQARRLREQSSRNSGNKDGNKT